MDIESETKKAKFGLFILIAFVCSTFFAYTELKFATSGKSATATVDRLYEEVGRRGRMMRRVQYHFHDDSGNLRNASDGIDDDWAAPSDGKIAVEYISDSSRLAGHRNIGALVVFFALAIGAIVAVILFVRHVREATRDSRPARR